MDHVDAWRHQDKRCCEGLWAELGRGACAKAQRVQRVSMAVCDGPTSSMSGVTFSSHAFAAKSNVRPSTATAHTAVREKHHDHTSVLIAWDVWRRAREQPHRIHVQAGEYRNVVSHKCKEAQPGP
jgi:hypothetical protein